MEPSRLFYTTVPLFAENENSETTISKCGSNNRPSSSIDGSLSPVAISPFTMSIYTKITGRPSSANVLLTDPGPGLYRGTSDRTILHTCEPEFQGHRSWNWSVPYLQAGTGKETYATKSIRSVETNTKHASFILIFPDRFVPSRPPCDRSSDSQHWAGLRARVDRPAVVPLTATFRT